MLDGIREGITNQISCLRTLSTPSSRLVVPVDAKNDPALVENIRTLIEACANDFQSVKGHALQDADDFYASTVQLPGAGSTQLFLPTQQGHEPSLKCRFLVGNHDANVAKAKYESLKAAVLLAVPANWSSSESDEGTTLHAHIVQALGPDGRTVFVRRTSNQGTGVDEITVVFSRERHK
jgi:hypothetical protein